MKCTRIVNHTVLTRIQSFFKGDYRSAKAKKNIAVSIVLKGIDSLVYLLLVPVTLGYLNSYEYGIWLTLNSILVWINSFDIGLGNGMRNRLTEAVAKKDYSLGRIYVSTTFIMLVLLMGGLILLGTLAEPFVNWYDILSTSPSQVPHLKEIVYVSFLIFCLNFIFKFIGNVYLAMQLPAVNNAFTVSGHLISLAVIYILTLTTTGSLFWVAVVYSASPLVVYLGAYPITFYKIFPQFRPSLLLFRKQYLRDLLSIGVQFFVLQLSGILLFAFANVLISHMFGPENVTPYNIAYRYFSLVPMAMGLLLAPIWSATADAYVKNDLQWIGRAYRSVKRILTLFTLLIVVMIIISKFVYQIWIGNEVTIPLEITVAMGVYVAILIWSLMFSSFLNGLGKLKLQTINTVIVSLLFIPLCYFLGIWWGTAGIVVGMCILNSSGLILNTLQFHKILLRKASGIWNR